MSDAQETSAIPLHPVHEDKEDESSAAIPGQTVRQYSADMAAEVKQKLERDFRLFFDDADKDGSDRMSTKELILHIGLLEHDVAYDLDAAGDLVLEIIALFEQEYGEVLLDYLHQDLYREDDPAGKISDPSHRRDESRGRRERAAAGKVRRFRTFSTLSFKKDLSVKAVVELLKFAYSRGMFTSYKAGAYYKSMESESDEGHMLIFATKLTSLFIWEYLKLLLMPIGVWFLDLAGRSNDYMVVPWKHRLLLFLISLPLWGLSYALVVLYYYNPDDVRSTVRSSEFLLPFMWMIGVCLMWNITRWRLGLGPFRNYRAYGFFSDTVARDRQLSQREIQTDVWVYDPDDTYAEQPWHFSEELGHIDTAFEIYRRLYDFHSCCNPRFRRDAKSLNLRKQFGERTIFEELFLDIKSTVFLMIMSVVYGLVACVVFLREEGDFIIDHSSSWVVFVAIASVLCKIMWSFAVLVAVRRATLVIEAFSAMLSLLSAMPSRRRVKVMQAQLPFNLRRRTELQLPWLNLAVPSHLLAWTEVRSALIHDQQIIVQSGSTLSFAGFGFFVCLMFYGAMLLSVLAFEAGTVGNAFRWGSFAGALVFTVVMHRFFAAASYCNEHMKDHVELLARLRFNVMARKTQQIRDESLERAVVSSGPDRKSAVLDEKLAAEEQEERASLIEALTTAIILHTDEYLAIFGFRISSEFMSTYRGLVALWFAVVVANFLFQDRNF